MPVAAAYKAGYHFVRSVPTPVALVAVRLASLAAVGISRERRLLVERNLRRALGDSISDDELRRKVAETFEWYGHYWVDSFKLPGTGPEVIDAGFTFSGVDRMLASQADGLGTILALPHLGGWEWAGFWIAQVLRVPITVVVEPVEPPELFDFFVRFRSELGMSIVPLGPRAGAEVLRAIKEGHIVCLLVDRDIAGDGIPVDFFGERTTMPAGPVTLSMRTGAPLLPAAVYYRDGRHHGHVGEPVDVSRQGRFRADVARGTQELADRLEALIRVAPEQWHLQQPNWPSDYDALAAIGKPHPRPGEARTAAV